MSNPISSLCCPLSQNSEHPKQVHGVLVKAALHANKSVLFDALAAAGIVSVLVLFGGSGDDPGQIEYIGALGADDANDALAPFPNVEVLYSCPNDDGNGIKTESCRVVQMVELLCFDLLRETHDGWENDTSAYGMFDFDVPRRTIGLDFYQLRSETENFEHNF